MLVSLGFVAAIALLLVAVSRLHPGSGADLLDWGPSRSYEKEVELELEDVQQMIDAQNERRRRDGRPEISEDGFRTEIDREQATGHPAAFDESD